MAYITRGGAGAANATQVLKNHATVTHYGGGYVPGPTMGNLATKHKNVPAQLQHYGPPATGYKTRPYSYVPPVSRISNPATRTHMPAQGTVSSIANPDTRTHIPQTGAIVLTPDQQRQRIGQEHLQQGVALLKRLFPGAVGQALFLAGEAIAVTVVAAFSGLPANPYKGIYDTTPLPPGQSPSSQPGANVKQWNDYYAQQYYSRLPRYRYSSEVPRADLKAILEDMGVKPPPPEGLP